MADLGGVAHLDGQVERVPITASFSRLRHVAALDQIGDDPLRCPLRDPDRLCDVTQAYIRVALQAQEHLRMARQKVPTTFFRT